MKLISVATTLALAVSAPLLAQAPSATIPSGYLAGDAPSSHRIPGKNAPARAQTTYNATLVGLPTGNINKLQLRADRSKITPFVAHTYNLTVHISSANVPEPWNADLTSYSANQGSDRTKVLDAATINFPAHQNPIPTHTWVALPIAPFPYQAGNNLQVEYDVASPTGATEVHEWYVDAVSWPSGIPSPGSFTRAGPQFACPPTGTTYGGSIGGPGETMSIWYYSTAGAGHNAHCFLGLKNNDYAGTPLPYDLGQVGYTGCKLYTELYIGTHGTTEGVNGRFRIDVMIPFQARFAGMTAYSQNFVFSPAFDHQLGASDLGTIVIGQISPKPRAVHLYSYTAPIDDTPEYTGNHGLVLGVN